MFASCDGHAARTITNVYNRALRPALERLWRRRLDRHAKGAPRPATTTRARAGLPGHPVHAFRKACGSLLLAHGKTLKQVQGRLRYYSCTTTMNVNIHQVDDGLGAPTPGTTSSRRARGATLGPPDTRRHPQNPTPAVPGENSAA